MTNEEAKIRIGAFEDLWKIENGHSSPELHKALQSIPKRLGFCIYHFDLLIEMVDTPSHIAFDSHGEFTRPNKRVSLRVEYEANFYAFVQGLHALIDSLPFILFLYEPVATEAHKANWNKGFLKHYKHGYPYYPELKKLFLNKRFHQIKGLVNLAKHGYLVRIMNSAVSLEIEEFTFKMPSNMNSSLADSSELTVPRQNLITFLMDCHNELIPEYLNLFNQIMNKKAADLNITDISTLPNYQS
jgi:hypothetical protein